GAFKLDAQGKIITVFPLGKARLPGMPRTLITGNELADRTIALNKKVRGHLHAGDAGEIRVFVSVQAILKKLLHLARTELPGRQADVMDHQQRNLSLRPLIEVRGRTVPDAIAPATGRVQLHNKL